MAQHSQQEDTDQKEDDEDTIESHLSDTKATEEEPHQDNTGADQITEDVTTTEDTQETHTKEPTDTDIR